ncbi:MAG TPA: cytochrome b/b6 domain-containing protein [Nitrococcus sp.]|nr:cytochrome b/b6 domain-containing protein [Nitrococcus sp.]
MSHASEIKVWDPVVRLFHWALVVAFFTAYFITEDDFLWLHTWAGYLILALLMVRIVWGFIGTRYARFSSFLTGPAESLHYLWETVTGRARRYLGHNPAGAAMIIAIFILLALATLSGIALYAADQGAGPLAGWIPQSKRLEEPLEDIHGLLANLTLALVIVHTMGVFLGSVVHNENLPASMIHGYKRRADKREDLRADEGQRADIR